jgi:hypothetical protein
LFRGGQVIFPLILINAITKHEHENDYVRGATLRVFEIPIVEQFSVRIEVAYKIIRFLQTDAVSQAPTTTATTISSSSSSYVFSPICCDHYFEVILDNTNKVCPCWSHEINTQVFVLQTSV